MDKSLIAIPIAQKKIRNMKQCGTSKSKFWNDNKEIENNFLRNERIACILII